MPYRRLPNTDAARLKALKMAHAKAKELTPFKLAFSQGTFQKIQSFLPNFEKVISEHRFNYANKIKKSKDFQKNLKKARMYISHFIQVLNMSIQRGEIPNSARTFYGIGEDDRKIPSLFTDVEVMEWGEKIIKGEAERIKKGLSPVTNPTIAVVKVRYENFADTFRSQQVLKKTSTRYMLEVVELRKEADEIIQMIWDEVETAFNGLPEEEKRVKAAEYGLLYVFRKNELTRLKLPETTQPSLFMQ